MKKILILLLCLLLILPIGACKGTDTTRIYTLNGTTGFGMAPLIQNAKNNETKGNYTFTVLGDATAVRDAIINGSADIAAVPTNVAAALYHATEGGVRVIALNTGGVLHLVSTDAAVNSLTDLAGKTLFVPAQNPAFITKAILDRANITGITLDSTTYDTPDKLRDALVNGLVTTAVLPEPMVSIACKRTDTSPSPVRVLTNLTTEWEKHYPKGSLVQGCVVVRTAYLEAHPDAVARFLEEYEASITYVIENTDRAAEIIAETEVFSNAEIAKAALPKCNLLFVTGEPMKEALSAFLATMPPKSIGGALPDDAFYYIPS